MKSRYKEIKAEYIKERNSIVLIFKERKLADAKWLNIEEAKLLLEQLKNAIQEVK